MSVLPPKKIKKALISVYCKEDVLSIANDLVTHDIEIISTGGTYDYLCSKNISVTSVESLTGYPSIFGGRVKTLHPSIMGGILFRRDCSDDLIEQTRYGIPDIDLVIVDLYPFEEYVAKGASEEEIIEKIDIGGISLIRAAAKNYKDVLIVPNRLCYPRLRELLAEKGGYTDLEDRKLFASYAFLTSSNYDTQISNYFNSINPQMMSAFSKSIYDCVDLRYGENPHQNATFYGKRSELPVQLHGKEISYNNLLDIESAIELISDFDDPTVAIIKHTNPCGCAIGKSILEAWNDALAADPVSAFGGIIIANRTIEKDVATEINKLFFEVIIAPKYEPEALELLRSRKNRIILLIGDIHPSKEKFRSLLGGVLVQERDSVRERPEELKTVTKLFPTKEEVADLLFANILVKHCKSNAIVLAKNCKLISNGVGQTSRVDALKQAIEKANNFHLPLDGAVMASDAFFPFPDCVEIAHQAGINAVIHPGGSINDKASIEYCDNHSMSMVTTGKRHFKH